MDQGKKQTYEDFFMQVLVPSVTTVYGKCVAISVDPECECKPQHGCDACWKKELPQRVIIDFMKRFMEFGKLAVATEMFDMAQKHMREFVDELSKTTSYTYNEEKLTVKCSFRGGKFPPFFKGGEKDA